MSERRFDLNGYELRDIIHVTTCGECGMGLVSAAEFHPWAACEEFKRSHDSSAVWRTLMPLVEELRR